MADLIELDCYKEYKNIKSTARDGHLQTLISQVSALVENYCNRTFIQHSKVEWFDGQTNSVELTEFPVIAVTSVKTSEDGGVNQTTLVEADSTKAGYFVDLEMGTVMTQRMVNKFIDDYEIPYRSLEIEYVAGYASQENLPEDLKLAVQDLVHYYEESESKPTQSLLGATRDNPQPYLANSFPPHIRRILDLYRYSAG
jgi:hypothetical protein